MAELQIGYISTIEGPDDANGNKSTARVSSEKSGGIVTKPLAIHSSIRGAAGKLAKGTEVVFVVFPDRSGIILSRADGAIFTT